MRPLVVVEVLSEINQLEIWLQNMAALVRAGDGEAAFVYSEKIADKAPALMELIGHDIKIWEK